jgi:hypothetical protein
MLRFQSSPRCQLLNRRWSYRIANGGASALTNFPACAASVLLAIPATVELALGACQGTAPQKRSKPQHSQREQRGSESGARRNTSPTTNAILVRHP